MVEVIVPLFLKVDIGVDNDLTNDEVTPKWWYNFLYACPDAKVFREKLTECGIQLAQAEDGDYNLIFENEQKYLLFVLRWS